MVIENDPSARMQLRSRGELVHPGQCMVCGNGTCDEGYIDLGVFFDYEGTMYLCKTCCYQAGETFGMFTPDEVKSQQELIERLTTENASLTEELENVAPIVTIYQRSLADFVDSHDFTASGLVPKQPEQYENYSPESAGQGEINLEESPSGNETDGDVTPNADEGKPESAEPVKSPKRTRSNGSATRDITF